MLRLEHVYKQLGTFKLKDINLHIKSGEYFVILGPTGTGKTIILETIAGMYKTDKGNIYINNKNVNTFPPEDRDIGFVYQDYCLFPHLSVKENILFGLKVRKKLKNSSEQILNEISTLLKINHLLSRNPLTLSGGEQQRVAFARAIVTSPQILLLDEVTSALDPYTKEIFQSHLKNIHKELKTTTLHITHDFDEALYLADKIAVIGNGEIVQIGTPEEIFNHPNSEFVANFMGFSNLFNCKLNNSKAILNNGIEFKVNNNKKISNATAAIRGENIVICKTIKDTFYTNNFQGNIISITNQGFISKVKIDIGIEVSAFSTENSLKNMNLNLGDKVFISIKNDDIHIF